MEKKNCAYELDGKCYNTIHGGKTTHCCESCCGIKSITIKQAQEQGSRYVVINPIGRIVFSSEIPLNYLHPGDKQMLISDYLNIIKS